MTVKFDVRANDAVVQVEWHGDELQKTIRSERANALYAGAQVILAAARPRAPRRRGELRKSGYAKAAGGKSSYRGGRGRRRPPKLRAGQAIAAFSAFYGGFQERGTRSHRARAFLGPALSSHKRPATQAVAAHMKRAADL